jgi:hypothetical protein
LESKSLLRNLALVLGATILGVVGPSIPCFITEGSKRNIFLSLIAVMLLLYGFGWIEEALQRVRIGLRNSHWIRPRVGILCGVSRSCSDEIPKVWSDITPEEWESEVKATAKGMGKKIRTKLVFANESFESYNAIINPFGGNYPETSFDGFPTYNKLLEYVRNGGLFVNVADIPTYWAYNPRLKRKLDRTPAVYGVAGEEARFFRRVPLMEELALRVRNVERPVPPEWPVQMAQKYHDYGTDMTTLLASRAAIVEGNVEPVIAPITVGTHSMTPLFFCNYGDGRCLISLSFLNGAFRQNRPLKMIIARLIVGELTS